MSARVVKLVPDAPQAEPMPDGTLPPGMRKCAAAGLRLGPLTLWHRAIAARIVEDAELTDEELRAIAHEQDDAGALCLGGPFGRLWALETLASRPTNRGPLGSLLGGARSTRATDYEKRTAYWLRRERTLRVPGELAIARAMVVVYRAWIAQIVRNLPQVVGTDRSAGRRDLDLASLDVLLGSSEAAADLRKKLGPKLLAVLRKAFQSAASEMAVEGVVWDPMLVTLDQVIGDKIVAVADTVRAAVKVAIDRGLSEGWSIAQMQDAIKVLPEMSPARALTVGRTESARVVTKGTNVALKQAVIKGARVRRTWVTARDSVVRESHTELEGVTVGVMETWTFSDGVSTDGPGESGVAEHDINCRCAMQPSVKKQEPKT